MSIRTERDESGKERMIVPESKRGVLVVEETVERLTGGGKFVVASVREYADVEVGNQVMITVFGQAAARGLSRDFQGASDIALP
jgi:hypothetical protein